MAESNPSWKPIGEPTKIAGYNASARIQSNLRSSNTQENFDTISQAAAEILGDSLKVKRLSDRVYELMQEDLKLQKERNRNY